MFKNKFGDAIFAQKYARYPGQTWDEKASEIVSSVCDGLMTEYECAALAKAIREFKFMPGGRYIYYAGREMRAYNNCYLLRAEEDTREEWGALANRAFSCLMTGGGIGVDYSRLRSKGSLLKRTGGQASGPIPLMCAINEIGRNVMQGGSRRSAIYASLDATHQDALEFLEVKNCDKLPIGQSGYTVADAKRDDFNYNAPLDMTNISLNWTDGFDPNGFIWLKNCEQAMRTGEPGFSFNFGAKSNETLRNACTEVTSEDDSDVCNLGSINLAEIQSITEFGQIVDLASKFLVCGTLRADLPYQKVYDVRAKNRRLGLGLMGIHSWLLQRGYGYEVVPELHQWLGVYATGSKQSADRLCDALSISRPVAYRAIAPTGTIGILAGTTTGIEPLFATAYKRRFLVGGSTWKYQYVVDNTAKLLVDQYGVDPDKIETAYGLSKDYERRIRFQADIQDYVDMSISSTINLPAWGSDENNIDKVPEFARILARYAHRLRGFTAYPDGSRGGQPLTEVPYREALASEGLTFEEHDACKGGVCGI
jgi:ribonucleoside-diphosphate reductase alpha chain